MATSVGSVVFSLSADIKDIQAQLRQIEGQFGSAANKITQSFKSVGTSLGGVFATGAISAYISKVVDLGDQLSDLADRTGFSVEVLGGLRQVTAANGTTIEALSAGALKAQRSLGELTDEGSSAGIALKALGLNIAQVINLSPDEFLETFAKALSTVENRNQRAAIAMQFFGKSAAELVPTLLAIAENGLPKLNKETADAYRNLGQFKDQLAVLAVNITDKIAPAISGLIQLLKLLSNSFSEQEKKGISLAKLTAESAKVEAQFRAATKARESGSRSGIASDSVFEEIKRKRQALIAQRIALIDQLGPTKPSVPTPGPLLNLGKPGAGPSAAPVDKLKAALDAYAGSLQKAIEKEEEQRIKLQFGELTALKAAQAFDTLALKETLLADGLKIPANVSTDAANATQFLQSLGVNVAQLSSKDFPALRDEYLKLADANEDLARAVKVLDDQYAVSNENLLQQTELTREQAAQLARLRQEFADLVQAQQIGAIKDPEQRRIAAIEVDFAKTAARIQELGRATGKSQEEIAAAIGEAWKRSLNEINNTVDETTQFQIQALSNIQDAIGSFIEDALNGNLKGWQAWADGVRKAINSVIAQILASRLNEFLLGPKAQTSQGQLGGVVGQGAGLLSGFFGGGGGSAVGFGSAPAGVAGPSAANGGFFSTGAGSLLSFFGFANGGRPQPFMPALVGERGPELFVPDTAGTIIPNNKLAGVAGGAPIVMNVYAQDAASFARSEHAITARLGGALQRAHNR